MSIAKQSLEKNTLFIHHVTLKKEYPSYNVKDLDKYISYYLANNANWYNPPYPSSSECQHINQFKLHF